MGGLLEGGGGGGKGYVGPPLKLLGEGGGLAPLFLCLWNRLIETVQMGGHNTCFYAEFTKIIPNYHQILSLI